MSQSWNGKALVDRIATELWDTSTGFRSNIINWINEIQDDLATIIPINHFRMKMKKLLPISLGDLTFLALYGTDLDGDIGKDVLTATASSGAIWRDGKAYIPSGEYIKYVGNNNFKGVDYFTIDIKFTPLWTGNPSGIIYLMNGSDKITTQNNLIGLEIQTNSQIKALVNDQDGNQVIFQVMDTLTFVSGTPISISLVFDIKNGYTYFFREGVGQGLPIVNTGVRSMSLLQMYFGARFNETTTSGEDFEINYIAAYSTVQHVDDFTVVTPVNDFEPDTESVNLSPNAPRSSTVTVDTGGSLVEDVSYKIYVTFLIFKEGGKNYIESEVSLASTIALATSTKKEINISNIPIYESDDSVSPIKIHRRIYMSKSGVGDTTFGEILFCADLENNFTKTFLVNTESVSTITPPSDTEVDRIAPNPLVFASAQKPLTQVGMNQLKRYGLNTATSTTPDAFDFLGLDSIMLYPRLDPNASEAERTLTYYIFRRPHEVFYEIDRMIDLPIIAKKALIAGVIWKGYEYRDRNGHQTKATNYEAYKRELIKKLVRQRGRPQHVQDVVGDVENFEV